MMFLPFLGQRDAPRVDKELMLSSSCSSIDTLAELAGSSVACAVGAELPSSSIAHDGVLIFAGRAARCEQSDSLLFAVDVGCVDRLGGLCYRVCLLHAMSCCSGDVLVAAHHLEVGAMCATMPWCA